MIQVHNPTLMIDGVRHFSKGVIVHLYICMHWSWNKGLPIFRRQVAKLGPHVHSQPSSVIFYCFIISVIFDAFIQ